MYFEIKRAPGLKSYCHKFSIWLIYFLIIGFYINRWTNDPSVQFDPDTSITLGSAKWQTTGGRQLSYSQRMEYNNPPLLVGYYVSTLSYWTNITPRNQLLLYNLLFFSIGAWALHLLVWEILRSHCLSLLTVLSLLTLPCILRLAISFEGEPGFLFMTALGVYFISRALKGDGKIYWWLTSVVTLVAYLCRPDLLVFNFVGLFLLYPIWRSYFPNRSTLPWLTPIFLGTAVIGHRWYASIGFKDWLSRSHFHKNGTPFLSVVEIGPLFGFPKDVFFHIMGPTFGFILLLTLIFPKARKQFYTLLTSNLKLLWLGIGIAIPVCLFGFHLYEPNRYYYPIFLFLLTTLLSLVTVLNRKSAVFLLITTVLAHLLYTELNTSKYSTRLKIWSVRIRTAEEPRLANQICNKMENLILGSDKKIGIISLFDPPEPKLAIEQLRGLCAGLGQSHIWDTIFSGFREDADSAAIHEIELNIESRNWSYIIAGGMNWSDPLYEPLEKVIAKRCPKVLFRTPYYYPHLQEFSMAEYSMFKCSLLR